MLGIDLIFRRGRPNFENSVAFSAAAVHTVDFRRRKHVRSIDADKCGGGKEA